MTRHVVITGMGGTTVFGENQQAVSVRLLAYENVVCKMLEWQVYGGLRTLLGAPVDDFTLPERYIRKRIRVTGRVSSMSTRATELALEQAGLISDRVLTSGETGIAHSSSAGSTGPVSEFATMLTEKHTNNITGTTYVQMMPHTTAVNIGLFSSLRGRVIPTPSVCTSGSQTISYVWEAIRHGYQTVIVVGGAEEPCSSEAVVFDTLFAANQRNDEPKITSSPLDEKRDGLVIGESAGTLVLEELEHAKARRVTTYGKIVSFATNCNAVRITQPQRETTQICMEKSLNMAGISARDIGYISAHGTATDCGDVAEGQATSAIYGDDVPLSSLKSYFGHTPGACDALEAWMGLQMMREGWLAPTLNLSQPDANCGALDYIMGEAHKVDYEFLQSNNLAFDGISTPTTIKCRPRYVPDRSQESFCLKCWRTACRTK